MCRTIIYLLIVHIDLLIIRVNDSHSYSPSHDESPTTTLHSSSSCLLLFEDKTSPFKLHGAKFGNHLPKESTILDIFHFYYCREGGYFYFKSFYAPQHFMRIIQVFLGFEFDNREGGRKVEVFNWGELGKEFKKKLLVKGPWEFLDEHMGWVWKK